MISTFITKNDEYGTVLIIIINNDFLKLSTGTKCSKDSAKFAGLIAIGIHVPRIIGTFSPLSPLFATLVLVFAVLAETARLGAIWGHIATVVAAFSPVSPTRAGIVLVDAVGSA